MVKQACPFVFLMAAMACGGSSSPSPTTPTPSTPTTSSIAVTGTASLAAIAQTSQLTATATLSNGTTQDVTALASWSSSNPAVATVSATGLVKATGLGTTTISAPYQGKTGTLLISVSNPGGIPNPTSCNALGPATLGTVTAQVNGAVTTFCILATGNSGLARSGGFFTLQVLALTSPYLGFTVSSAFNGPVSSGTVVVAPSFTVIGSDITGGWVVGLGASGVSGTLTLTTVTNAGATGTFSFTAVRPPSTGGSGTLVVTGGVFNITSWSQ